MNLYTIYWKNGKREVVAGPNVVEALLNAGYSATVLRMLAFYLPGDNKGYLWNEKFQYWQANPAG
jgi:hypothetical protein